MEDNHLYGVQSAGKIIKTIYLKSYINFGKKNMIKMNFSSILNPFNNLWLFFRNLTFHSEVSYVKTKKEEDNESKEDEELYKQIKGSLSTKVEAVVKTLIKIQTLDPNAKSLVFSTWNGVLDILGEALERS